MAEQSQSKHHSRTLPPGKHHKGDGAFTLRKLLLTLAIIIAAIIALKTLFNYHQYRNMVAAIKHGILLEPPVDITPLLKQEKTDYPAIEDLLNRKWGLLYISAGPCRDTCINNIAKMLDVRDQYAAEINIPYIMLVSLQSKATTNDPIKQMLQQQYPTIWYVDTDNVDLQQFLDHVPANSQTLSTDRLYIINKKLQAVASYNPEIPTRDLAADFQAADHE
ncbi:MAG: hypothetical protein ACK4PR_00960 [Gammaproteobacteria bacterium]